MKVIFRSAFILASMFLTFTLFVMLLRVLDGKNAFVGLETMYDYINSLDYEPSSVWNWWLDNWENVRFEFSETLATFNFTNIKSYLDFLSGIIEFIGGGLLAPVCLIISLFQFVIVNMGEFFKFVSFVRNV